jgi:hypothetical protein
VVLRNKQGQFVVTGIEIGYLFFKLDIRFPGIVAEILATPKLFGASTRAL